MPRAGSALDYLAAAIIALAVFALPVSIVALAMSQDNPWFLLSVALAWPLAAAALVWLIRQSQSRAGRRDFLTRLAGTTLVTWTVGFLAGIFVLGIAVSTNRCTGSAAGWIGEAGALTIYAGAGGWSLARADGKAIWVMPVAVVLSLTWMLLAFRLLPAGPGFCGD